jgi:hypothetical protein
MVSPFVENEKAAHAERLWAEGQRLSQEIETPPTPLAGRQQQQQQAEPMAKGAALGR